MLCIAQAELVFLRVHIKPDVHVCKRDFGVETVEVVYRAIIDISVVHLSDAVLDNICIDL